METLLSGLASFLFFHFTSRPKGKIKKKFPDAKIKRVQIFPSLSIEVKNRHIHIHHWMILAPLYVLIQTVGRGVVVLQSDILHGAILGGILQGLLYNDSFKFIHKPKDYQKTITTSSYHKPPFWKKLFG